MANKIPNGRQTPSGMRRGSDGQKNVVSGGRRQANPVSEINSMMKKAKRKGPGVNGR